MGPSLRTSLALLLLCPTSAARADHALIVAVNEAQVGRPDRHFADDDGAKLTEIYDALYGPGHTTLLTRFDPPTRALFPALVARTDRPTLAAVGAAFARLGETLKAEAEGRRRATIVLTGSGGHVGEGYFLLEDGKLGAAALAKLLKDLPAEQIDLVIDAKNARSMVRADPRLGVVLASSTDRAVWESNELQSGVFAHVFRSALRGAADADRDRSVSYRELGAFIADAIVEVPEGLRPSVFIAGSEAHGAEGLVARFDREGLRKVALELPVARRVTLRDERGLRVLDGHFLAGAPLPLVLPAGLLVLEERGLVDQVETTRTGFIAEGADAIGMLPGDAPSEPGGDPVRGLFTGAFGPGVVASYHVKSELVIDGGDGVSRADAVSFGHVLESAAHFEARSRMLGGLSLLSIGIVAGGTGLAFLDTAADDAEEALGGILVGTGVVAIVAGAITVIFPAELERMHESFEKVSLDDEVERAALLRKYELRFADEAADYRTSRLITAGTSLALGVVTIIGGVILGFDDSEISTEAGFLVGTGVLLTGLGAYNLGARHEIEELWDLYQRLHPRAQ